MSSLVARTTLFESMKREACRAEAMLICATALHSDADARTKVLDATAAIELGLECERASLFVVDAVAAELFLISSDLAAFGTRMPLTSGVAGECATTGEQSSRSNQLSMIAIPQALHRARAVPILRQACLDRVAQSV